MTSTTQSRGHRAVRISTILATVLTMLVGVAGTAFAQIPASDPTIKRETLTSGLADPTALATLPDGRVLWVHREGKVMIWKQDGTVVQAAKLPVDAFDRSQTPGGQYGGGATCPRAENCPASFELAEGGIHGVLLDPDFATNGQVYLYYTVVDSDGHAINPPKMPGARGSSQPPTAQGGDPSEGKFRLSRFTLTGDTLDLSSEVALFENPAEWFHCCHYGGDIEWLSDGTLVMTVGDDTISDFSGGYSPHDTRPDMEWNNAVLTSQNVADRRGKVLRIDVRDVDGDGSDIPQDNPFLDVPGADPYVYAMGFRSDYRLAVDLATDTVYVSTVGPDGGNASTTRGPAAHEEIEVVPPGGGSNHGWPYCIANNIAYNEYDFETGQAGALFSCAGMTPAAFWYTYRPSPTSPYVQMGQGSNTVIVGDVYDRPATGALRLPASYDNQLLWGEFNRDQIWRSPVRADGTLANAPTDLLPVFTAGLSGPIDTAIGVDGAVYLMEYGTGTWNNTNGRLSRISCAACLPNADDYAPGTIVKNPSAALAVAGVGADERVANLGPLWGLLALAVLLTGRGIARRRSVA